MEPFKITSNCGYTPKKGVITSKNATSAIPYLQLARACSLSILFLVLLRGSNPFLTDSYHCKDFLIFATRIRNNCFFKGVPIVRRVPFRDPFLEPFFLCSTFKQASKKSPLKEERALMGLFQDAASRILAELPVFACRRFRRRPGSSGPARSPLLSPF